MPRRLLSGRVVSSNSNKTIVVEVIRRVKHKLYKKIIEKRVKHIVISLINEHYQSGKKFVIDKDPHEKEPEKNLIEIDRSTQITNLIRNG